jgi:hypothetical protein
VSEPGCHVPESPDECETTGAAAASMGMGIDDEKRENGALAATTLVDIVFIKVMEDTAEKITSTRMIAAAEPFLKTGPELEAASEALNGIMASGLWYVEASQTRLRSKEETARLRTGPIVAPARARKADRPFLTTLGAGDEDGTAVVLVGARRLVVTRVGSICL